MTGFLFCDFCRRSIAKGNDYWVGRGSVGGVLFVSHLLCMDEVYGAVA